MRFIALTIMLVLAACKQNATQTTNGSRPTTPPTFTPTPLPADLPRVNTEPYQGPRAIAQVLERQSDPVQYVVQVSLTAPTGGWTLSLDEGRVVNDVAVVFLTLERPAEDEMVTQALAEHRTRFATTDRFKAVEVYIHLAQRGVYTLTTDYRLAARSATASSTTTQPPEQPR